MVKLVEVYGLGPLVPNVILLGDSEDASRRDRYCNTILQIHQAKRSVMVLRENSERGFGAYRRIDVWWGGMHTNGSLMLLLAYLLRSTLEWRDAQIYLKLVVSNEAAAQNASANLNNMLSQLRISAIPK